LDIDIDIYKGDFVNTAIYAIYPNLDRYFLVNIFGYSSKGIPGLEIVGLGRQGRLIKEKLIYLSRIYRLQLPLKRYVICVEDDCQIKDSLMDNCSWLELPMLILFWSLANFIPIKKLDDCVASGRISISGKVEILKLKQQTYLKMLEQKIIDCKYIAPRESNASEDLFILPIEEIFTGKGGMSFSLNS